MMSYHSRFVIGLLAPILLLAILCVPVGVAPPGAAAPLALTTTPTPRVPYDDIGSEILYLKAGALHAYDPQRDRERFLVGGVREFVATPDGRRLALLLGDASDTDLWLVERDGSGLQLLLDDDRVLATLDWAPDGMSLVYTSADQAPPELPNWPDWARWCGAGEIRRFDLPLAREQRLAQGCEPAFAPDGRRIAYATRPGATMNDQTQRMLANQVRLMNREGLHSWRFASADPDDGETGLLVYAPAWGPNGGKVAYHRYLGMQVEVDIVLTEWAGAWSGHGDPIGWGAGWLRPAVFSSDQQYAALLEHNYSDARGFSGYEIWGVQVVKLGEPGSITLPSGELSTVASEVDALPRAAAVAWAPAANQLAVLLPPDWQPDVPISEPQFSDAVPGELWRWTPGSAPAQRLISGLDFATPLRWLPAPPQRSPAPAGGELYHPSDWRIRSGADLLEVSDPAGERLMAARRLDERGLPQVADLFPEYVAPGGLHSRPIRWPDGSVYRGFSGRDPTSGQGIAGAIRIYSRGDTRYVLLYRTTAGHWLYERSTAQALLAASGRDE